VKLEHQCSSPEANLRSVHLRQVPDKPHRLHTPRGLHHGAPPFTASGTAGRNVGQGGLATLAGSASRGRTASHGQSPSPLRCSVSFPEGSMQKAGWRPRVVHPISAHLAGQVTCASEGCASNTEIGHPQESSLRERRGNSKTRRGEYAYAKTPGLLLGSSDQPASVATGLSHSPFSHPPEVRVSVP